MIDEWAQSQSTMHLDCCLTRVTPEKCQRVNRSQGLAPPRALSFFFSAGATLKFITEVVLTNHTSTKGEAIEGVLLVVTVTWPERVLVLLGPLLPSVSRGRGGALNPAFTFVSERAKRIGSPSTKRRRFVWEIKRAPNSSDSSAPHRPLTLLPPGLVAPTEFVFAGVCSPSPVVCEAYRRRWGAPAHAGLLALRGCRRGERRKPGRSRSWWHWSESGWSYWWGSAGNLLLEANARGVGGGGVEVGGEGTTNNMWSRSHFTPPSLHTINIHAQRHADTHCLHRVILQTSEKKKKWAYQPWKGPLDQKLQACLEV